MPPEEARGVDRLTPVPLAARTALAAGPADAATHAAAVAATPALHEIEVGGVFPRAADAGRLRVAAWNTGRLHDPDAAADLLASTGADVVQGGVE